MKHIKDLTNIAYSDEYINYRNNVINIAYNENIKTKENEIIEANLKRIITEYSAIYDDKKYYCNNNKVYDENNKLIHEYFNLYNHPFFCNEIKYNNGKRYLFYREALYGYSVFEIETNKVFNYYPQESFINKKETFIGTDIYHNPANNIFAVGGCYWACPDDTFLLKIDNLLNGFDKYINIHFLIEEEYDKYDDIEFSEWENNNIKVKCYNVETLKYDIIVITEEEYTGKMLTK